MRLCVLTSSYPRYPDDGAGSFVRSLCRHLGAVGHKVHVLAPYDGGLSNPPSDPNLSISFFPYSPFKRLRVIGYGQSLYADVRLRTETYLGLGGYAVAALIASTVTARAGGFDILHAHWCVPSGFLAALVARLLHMPLVVSLHGSDVFLASKGGVAGKCAGFALRSASAVVACSEDLARKAVSLGAPPERTMVIPYGVDVDRMDLCARAVASVRSRYRIGVDEQAVVAVGRLVRKKGFEYLIRAWPLIADGGTGPVRLIIGGDGDLRQDLRDLARQVGVADQIIFAGALNWRDAGELLAASDVVALPSVLDDSGNVDGLPNVLLEAMAAGKPVVTTPVGGIGLAITHGENGLLVPERSPESLAEATRRLLLSPELRKALGSAGRARVERDFSWPAVARQYCLLYKAAAERSLRQRRDQAVFD